MSSWPSIKCSNDVFSETDYNENLRLQNFNYNIDGLDAELLEVLLQHRYQENAQVYDEEANDFEILEISEDVAQIIIDNAATALDQSPRKASTFECCKISTIQIRFTEDHLVDCCGCYQPKEQRTH